MDVRAALASAVDVVRQRIQQIRERKQTINEQNTKAALIDPILAALGWDLQNIDEVQREYHRKPQDNPVDYGLFLNATPRLFAEAKSLEKDLTDRKWLSQNLSYATVVGVRWCVLTNGDEYRIYNSHAEVDVEQKLFRSVRVSDAANAGHVIDTLSLLSKAQMQGTLLDELWKAHFIDRNVRLSIEGLLINEDPGFIRLVRKKARGVTNAEVRASLKRAKVSIDFPAPAMSEPRLPQPTVAGVGRGTPKAARTPGSVQKAAPSDTTLMDLIQAGLVQPPFEVERDYKGIHLTAVIRQDGRIDWGGQVFDSLSTAGGMARKSVIGSPDDGPCPPTSGWQFWRYRDAESGELRKIDSIRRKFLATRH